MKDKQQMSMSNYSSVNSPSIDERKLESDQVREFTINIE